MTIQKCQNLFKVHETSCANVKQFKLDLITNAATPVEESNKDFHQTKFNPLNNSIRKQVDNFVPNYKGAFDQRTTEIMMSKSPEEIALDLEMKSKVDVEMADLQNTESAKLIQSKNDLIKEGGEKIEAENTKLMTEVGPYFDTVDSEARDWHFIKSLL